VAVTGPKVQKKDTNFHTPVSAEEGLLITLRWGIFVYLLVQIFHTCINKTHYYLTVCFLHCHSSVTVYVIHAY